MGVFVLNKEKYFAAINSGFGFISYFDRIFNTAAASRLYVIKSGPGTGKSSMMKRIAEAAEKAGHKVVYFYCSSDPYSLDGILIPSLSAGVLDGTAPHATDPKYPGAADVLLDFYPYLDDKKLAEHKTEIIALTDKNRALHKKSSSYRRYAALAAREALDAVRECVDTDKLNCAVKRAAGAVKAEKGRAEHRQISAFSSRGRVRFDTYEQSSHKINAVCDEHGSACLFMNSLRAELIKKETAFYYSTDTLLPENCEAIFLPDAKECFVITGKAADTDRGDYTKVINMKRFIKPDAYKAARGRIRLCEKTKKALDDEALKIITAAGETHDELEKYYISATDFDGVRAETDRVIEKLNI